MSTGCKSSHNGFLDVSRSNGGLSISGCIGTNRTRRRVNTLMETKRLLLLSQTATFNRLGQYKLISNLYSSHHKIRGLHLQEALHFWDARFLKLSWLLPPHIAPARYTSVVYNERLLPWPSQQRHNVVSMVMFLRGFSAFMSSKVVVSDRQVLDSLGN